MYSDFHRYVIAFVPAIGILTGKPITHFIGHACCTSIIRLRSQFKYPKKQESNRFVDDSASDSVEASPMQMPQRKCLNHWRCALTWAAATILTSCLSLQVSFEWKHIFNSYVGLCITSKDMGGPTLNFALLRSLGSRQILKILSFLGATTMELIHSVCCSTGARTTCWTIVLRVSLRNFLNRNEFVKEHAVPLLHWYPVGCDRPPPVIQCQG